MQPGQACQSRHDIDRRHHRIDQQMQSLRSARALCLLCWLLCLCYVMAARFDTHTECLPFSIFVGALSVVVMFMHKNREPGARPASRQEVLAATISICVVVGYISTLFKPICMDLTLVVADALQPFLQEWWPEPKPPPPPPPPWWCPWSFQAVHQFPGFLTGAWNDRCLKEQVDWHVKSKLDGMMKRWLESLALGYITTCILFHVPFFVFRDLANSYTKVLRKVTVNDKGKMCLGIVAWACFLSVLPAVRISRPL